MKIHKKTKLKKRVYLLLAVLAVVSAVLIVVFTLLLHRPAYYQPLDLAHSKEVSLYLTNELLPELYNGAQRQEPFNLEVTQNGINDIVARLEWPKKFGSIEFSAPMVLFLPNSIILMGTLFPDGSELVVTIAAEPKLDAAGLLNLQVANVKIGAVDITPLAGLLAERIYKQQFATKGIDTKNLWAQVMQSLLHGKAFEPVFKIADKKVRVEKIIIEQKKLTVRLAPVFD